MLNEIIQTHFMTIFHFCTPWKRQKTRGLLTLSGGIEMENWRNMGLVKPIDILVKNLFRQYVSACFYLETFSALFSCIRFVKIQRVSNILET